MSTSVAIQNYAIDGERNGLGFAHALQVFTRPRLLFDRVEDTGRYGWSLLTLIVLVVLIGYAEAQSGLIDRAVDRQTETALATLEKTQATLVDRVELSDRMEGIRKQGEFNKLISRLGVIVFAPIYLLGSLLLISSILYALVALTGRKPEYHTLMSICVYSGFVLLAGAMLRLAMVLFYRTTALDTSLAALAAPGEPSVLAAVDPFRLWFWVLVTMGLLATRQLGRKLAIACCLMMVLIGFGVRVAITFATAA